MEVSEFDFWRHRTIINNERLHILLDDCAKKNKDEMFIMPQGQDSDSFNQCQSFVRSFVN